MNVRDNNYKMPMEVNTSDIVYRTHTNDNYDAKEEGVIYYDDGTYKEEEEFLDEKEVDGAYGEGNEGYRRSH